MTDLPHVCFVSPKIYNFLNGTDEDGAGGAERQQNLIAQRLLAAGYEVSYLTRRREGAPIRETQDGIAVWNAIPDTRGSVKAPYKLAVVTRTLRRTGADTFYVRGNDFLCMVTSAYCRATGCNFLYAVSSDADIEPQYLERHHPLHSRAFLWAVRSADAVTALTRHQVEVLDTAYSIDAEHISGGYDLPDDDPPERNEREYVLWVGRMDSEQKKPQRFLELAESLPETEFVMVGPPNDDEEAFYEEIRERASSIPNLRFEGFVDPDQIHEYYRDSIALVNTSDYEGFPNVFMEAWRHETPVVSLYYDVDDMLDREEIGIRSGSMEALLQDVARLIGDPELQDRLGEAGKAHLRENHSLDAVVAAYRRLFEGQSPSSP